MTNKNFVILSFGILALAGSIWLLLYMIKETKRGYRSGFGNDIKLYVGSVMGIILGLVLIYKVLL